MSWAQALFSLAPARLRYDEVVAGGLTLRFLDFRVSKNPDIQDLLGHRHITTTQIYDKRRRSTSKSAPHDGPI